MSGRYEHLPMVMNKGERDELASVVKRNHKVAKAAVAQRQAEVLADFEETLAKEWEPVELAAQETIETARKAERQLQQEIAESWKERGLPKEFMPQTYFGMSGRGSNALSERRTELRRVATTRAEALAQKAKVAIETSEAAMLTELAAGGLTSDEAKEFLGKVPKPDELLPALTISEMQKELPSLRRNDQMGNRLRAFRTSLDELDAGEW